MPHGKQDPAQSERGLPIYLFSASFSAFAGWKLSFLAAATLTVAPVDGLRASPLIKTQEP